MFPVGRIGMPAHGSHPGVRVFDDGGGEEIGLVDGFLVGCGVVLAPGCGRVLAPWGLPTHSDGFGAVGEHFLGYVAVLDEEVG